MLRFSTLYQKKSFFILTYDDYWTVYDQVQDIYFCMRWELSKYFYLIRLTITRQFITLKKRHVDVAPASSVSVVFVYPEKKNIVCLRAHDRDIIVSRQSWRNMPLFFFFIESNVNITIITDRPNIAFRK